MRYIFHEHKHTHTSSHPLTDSIDSQQPSMPAVMANTPPTTESLIEKLGYQPRHVMTGMIKTKDPKIPSPSQIARISTASSSLGSLESLPLEMLHIIFAALDLRSLSRMASTCLRGVAVVEALPQWRDLVKHAPGAMAALGRTQLTRHHTVTTLHDALSSADCASCGAYGAFLFLPTCERCCYECLWRNQSLQVIQLALAKKAFGLSAAQIEKLPIMRGIPGKYWVRYQISRSRPQRLVSVKAAKILALQVHGSKEDLARQLEPFRASGPPSPAYVKLHQLQRAPLKPLGPLSALDQRKDLRGNDEFCGMASIPFACCLAGKQVEHGIWCLGCKRANHDGPDRSLDPLETRYLRDSLGKMVYVAWSTNDFLEHIKRCKGAVQLVPDMQAQEERRDDCDGL